MRKDFPEVFGVGTQPRPQHVRRPRNDAVPALTREHRDAVIGPGIAGRARGMAPIATFDPPKKRAQAEPDMNPSPRLSPNIHASAAARGNLPPESPVAAPAAGRPEFPAERGLVSVRLAPRNAAPAAQDPEPDGFEAPKPSAIDEAFGSPDYRELPASVAGALAELVQAGADDPAALLVALRDRALESLAVIDRLDDPNAIGEMLGDVARDALAFRSLLASWAARGGDPAWVVA